MIIRIIIIIINNNSQTDNFGHYVYLVIFDSLVLVYECLCISTSTTEKIKYKISLAVGDVELMHECFPKHSHMGTARIK